MNANLNTVEKLLRRQRRWNQYAWPLIAAAVGLAATLVFEWRLHPSFARVVKWGHLPRWWIGGLAVTLIAAAVIYFLRRKSALQAAQIMDARWNAKNRLETADALSAAPDAIARAQHEETAGFIQQSQLRPRGIPLAWLRNLVILLVLAHLFMLASWTRPLSSSLFAGKKNNDSAENSSAGNAGNTNSSAAEQSKAKAAAAAAAAAAAKSKSGSIVWNTPEEEIKAAAVEEVPLEAVADSTTGFHDMVLKISVNGESRPPIPIEMPDLKNAGKHTIQTSIYMDKLGVKPYDMVSYDLHAQRNGNQPSEVASPMQFVEIKPLREEVHESQPTKKPGQSFDYITAIKSAQLRALKENYALAHSELSHDSDDWKDENDRVGTDQKTLEAKTGEAVSQLASMGVPEEILGLMRQAQPEMTDAAQKISATENEPALAPQGKALALITQVEKYLVKVVGQGPPSPAQPASDPFDKKALELKRRDMAPAGELEILAKEQARLAADIATTNTVVETPPDAAKPDPEKITGTPTERESQINQRVGTVLETANFAAEITNHLELGRRQAQVALLSLGIDDLAAAAEPAAASARELQLAADAMNRAAEQVAKDELADALRALSDAAGGARITPTQPSDSASQQQAANVMKQVADAARKLNDEAQQQQQTGSAKAATQLNELAKAIAATDVQKALKKFDAQPRDTNTAQNAANKLQDVADQAGLMRNNGQLSPTGLAQLADRLERAHANIQRLIAQNSAAKSPGNAPNNPPANSPNSPAANPPNSSPNNPPGNTPSSSPSGSPGSMPNSPAQGSPNNPPNGSSSPNMAASDLPVQTTSLSPTFANGGAQGSFGGEVISNVREALLEAVPALPKSYELAALRGELRNAPEPDAPDIDMTAFMQKIDPQLENVIKLLREKSQGEQRPFQLTEEQVAQAPAAYRPAVADYFEKLSRDYPADSKAPAK